MGVVHDNRMYGRFGLGMESFEQVTFGVGRRGGGRGFILETA